MIIVDIESPKAVLHAVGCAIWNAKFGVVALLQQIQWFPTSGILRHPAKRHQKNNGWVNCREDCHNKLIHFNTIPSAFLHQTCQSCGLASCTKSNSAPKTWHASWSRSKFRWSLGFSTSAIPSAKLRENKFEFLQEHSLNVQMSSSSKRLIRY